MLDFIIFIGRINYKYYMEDLFMSKYYSINKFSKILGVSRSEEHTSELQSQR